jgi:hypothetical protein
MGHLAILAAWLDFQDSILPTFRSISSSVATIGMPCFFDDDDRRRYGGMLREAASRYDCRLSAVSESDD